VRIVLPVRSANVSSDITASAAWRKLHDHHGAVAGRHLREFSTTIRRAGRELTVQVGELQIDYSKHRVTREPSGCLSNWRARPG